jgi:energy-coupling factor transport system ATP-binding protein
MDISLDVGAHDFIGIIGHTGSGKSTFIQHLNRLLVPTTGTVVVNNIDINKKGVLMKDIVRRVGIVFQYPEYQLFEETVYKDVAFGPKNIGFSEEKVDFYVRESLGIVGLDFDEIKDVSPFDLSGGQKRRVAIAGVLAMKPPILILDEPTSGLDPMGRIEILDSIKKMNKEKGICMGLDVPQSRQLLEKLKSRGVGVSTAPYTTAGTIKELLGAFKQGKPDNV